MSSISSRCGIWLKSKAATAISIRVFCSELLEGGSFNDGAACILLASEKKVNELNLTPIARVVSFADAAHEPAREAAAEHLVHHLGGEVVRVLDLDPQVPDADVGLGDVVLLDEVDAAAALAQVVDLGQVGGGPGRPAAGRANR